MSRYFRIAGENGVQWEVRRAEERAYFSEYNDCYVVPFQCEKCRQWYEEEKEAAKAKIVCNEQMVCISCDSDAEEASVRAVKVGYILVVTG